MFSAALTKVDDITAVAIVASTLMVFNKRTGIVGKIELVLRLSGLKEIKMFGWEIQQCFRLYSPR